jgi:long-chain acyl-CoA synthetase
MNFLEQILNNLESSGSRPVLQEPHESGLVTATGAELRAQIEIARSFFRSSGLQKGDRCVLLAPNSIRWVAADMALMAEGVIAVPLNTRQTPAELAVMIRDASPELICAGDATLADAMRAEFSSSPRVVLFDEIFSANTAEKSSSPLALVDSDPLTIIYTSGTSGEPKGVILTAGNVNFMLGCIMARLDQLMSGHADVERVLHYAPFNFAAAWMLLLSCLSRKSLLTLSMNISRIQDEMKIAAPNYFLNVPLLLERVRRGVEDNVTKTGGIVAKIFNSAKSGWFARHDIENPRAKGGISLAIARIIIFPTIRKKIGPNLKALICGSAPLLRETQLFFMMIGIPVLQAYGLTETTAICTLDIPGKVEPGWVGSAVPGIEMKLGADEEILVRGPNISPGYWNRPEESAKVLRDGWFHSGDQGEVNPNGNWRIIGRIKNLLVLSSGHNVAPEPIEEELQAALPRAQQVVLIGHGRSYLIAIVAGEVNRADVMKEIETMNADQPHYKRIHGFHVEPQAFTMESGLMTANGKLRRNAISEYFAPQIEAIYREKRV